MLSASLLAQNHCDAIDINLGCPQVSSNFLLVIILHILVPGKMFFENFVEYTTFLFYEILWKSTKFRCKLVNVGVKYGF